MGSVKAECPKRHKVYQIPEERLPEGEEVSFPCPACKGVIKLRRSAADPEAGDPSSASPPVETGDPERGEALKARILKGVKELPPMPQTVFKAREVLGNPQSSFQEVAGVLETDQAIAARILKMANSAYYGLMGKVSSIQHASVVLGYKTLSEIVVLAGGSAVLGNILAGYDLAAGDLWQHSLAVAFGSKIIASRKNPALENDAFAAGLIHDAGKLILDPYVMQRKDAFRRFMAEEERPFLIAEREILGFDHAEIAFELCRTWNVPQVLVSAIRYHHTPDRSQGNELVHMVHTADAIAMMSGVGAGLDGMHYELDDGVVQGLGLQEDDITAIMVEMVESVGKVVSDMSGS
ncbi:MAG: HDOD domain-containing protein [Deltaproteobacteria bacterium]|nr:HDOD domain-containing protein [Deltaproteobacteria bacterium]